MFASLQFAGMARSITQLIEKGVPFLWTDKHTAAVEALEHALCNYSVLQMPDLNKLYVL